MGTGAQFVGYRPVGSTHYEVQRWVTVLFAPVVPIDTWVIEPVALEGVNMGAVVGETFRYRIIGRTRTSPTRVLAIYAAAAATVVAALAPLALLVRQAPKGPQPMSSVILFVVAAVWPVIVLGWVNHRRERLYERGEWAAPSTRTSHG